MPSLLNLIFSRPPKAFLALALLLVFAAFDEVFFLAFLGMVNYGIEQLISLILLKGLTQRRY